MRIASPVVVSGAAIVLSFGPGGDLWFLVALASLALTCHGSSGVLGDIPLHAAGSADPAEVHSYRHAHPGATIADALRALDERDGRD